MERFIQLVIDGIAIGSIYGALALALVLIFRSTGIVNFAQGEMAMFSTFVAWALVQAGLPLGLALLTALAASFLGGMLIERVISGDSPCEGSSSSISRGRSISPRAIASICCSPPESEPAGCVLRSWSRGK